MPRTYQQQHNRYGNINPLSIAYATRLGLGPTNPGMIIMAQETSLFRWAGFSPALWLLIPTFSLVAAPPDLAVQLHCWQQRSSTTPHKCDIHIFGTTLEPRYIFRARSLDEWAVTHSLNEWLLLSQHPHCLRNLTSFPTERRFRDLRWWSGLFPFRAPSLAPTF